MNKLPGNSIKYDLDKLIQVINNKYYPDNVKLNNFTKFRTVVGHYLYQNKEVGYNINFLAYNEGDQCGLTWNLLYDINRDFGMIDNAKQIYLSYVNFNEPSHYNTKLQTYSYLLDFMNSMKRYYKNKNFRINK